MSNYTDIESLLKLKKKEFTEELDRIRTEISKIDKALSALNFNSTEITATKKDNIEESVTQSAPRTNSQFVSPRERVKLAREILENSPNNEMQVHGLVDAIEKRSGKRIIGNTYTKVHRNLRMVLLRSGKFYLPRKNWIALYVKTNKPITTTKDPNSGLEIVKGDNMVAAVELIFEEISKTMPINYEEGLSLGYLLHYLEAKGYTVTGKDRKGKLDNLRVTLVRDKRKFDYGTGRCCITPVNKTRA